MQDGAKMTEPTQPAPEAASVSKEARDTRFSEQMVENEEIMRESANVLKSVTDKLNKAADKLSQYGHPPFEDLER
jgi:hypothetical protein